MEISRAVAFMACFFVSLRCLGSMGCKVLFAFLFARDIKGRKLAWSENLEQKFVTLAFRATRTIRDIACREGYRVQTLLRLARYLVYHPEVRTTHPSKETDRG